LLFSQFLGLETYRGEGVEGKELKKSKKRSCFYNSGGGVAV